MYHIKGRNIDDIVTPNHGYPIYNRYGNFNDFYTAEEIYNNKVRDQHHSYIPKQGNWDIKGDDYFILKGIYDAKESALTFDRSNTQNPGAISKRTIPVHPDEFGSISFNCLVDTCSIEIFVNGGEIAFTNAFFVEPAANGVSIQSKMKSIIFFDYYRLGDSKKQ